MLKKQSVQGTSMCSSEYYKEWVRKKQTKLFQGPLSKNKSFTSKSLLNEDVGQRKQPLFIARIRDKDRLKRKPD